MSNSYLRFPPTPSLPLAPQQWGPLYQDQYSNVLRLYFNQLSNNLGQLASPLGGQRLSFPFGAFSDSTTQTIASTTTAYPITLNTTTESNGVRLSSGSRFVVEQEGVYNLQFSIQFNSDSNAEQDADVWVRLNGVDIPASNSRFGLPPRKSSGDPFHTIGALNFVSSMRANDYLQLVWSSTSTDVSIVNYATGTSPTRPAIPSVIASLTFVSALVQ
jgi:hypothetical protein